MGNSLPLPCVCYDAGNEPAAAIAGAKRRRRKKSTACRNVRAARHVVPVDMPEEGDGEEEEEIKAAWPGCRVEPAVGDDGGMRVKIVMKRKEVEELVGRLEQREAAERKARMEELNAGLGGGGAAAAVTMSPCRDAWRPRLASIQEN